MAAKATAPRQTVWDCAWSRPGYRLFGIEDQLQPEALWVCVRGERRNVTEAECETCAHWVASPEVPPRRAN
jgi:hypothetical protein